MCASETVESSTGNGLSKPETECVCSAEGGFATVWEGVGARFGSSGNLCDTNRAGWLGAAICARETEESETASGLNESETDYLCSAEGGLRQVRLLNA
ncbi:uncharacterized protein EMH_0016520 [Eimeria mitis]|uniref:Uncharacterized protein n=1 Tax=Eimeria mitis TaxID=44415 RepID=U6KEQ7_9EIME|nr:uncharacterized protein EMH_0079200 [Eimeria mitis]XP_037878697.1 uncharacterized protein EMH_0016520 [Eimeria mitis]CDJ36333.1 hypothetical protein, conserved [Eimeria mitis]CDJ36409.1 hypothetical protein EMH_0016520 [Eimeria mitis]